jgi:AcrR family transcriptional regulator
VKEAVISMEQTKSTKERILTEALTLFSVKGYEAVSVAEIAKAVGIKAPSLYKHYKSKQDIFEAIIAEMDARYDKLMSSMRLDGKEAEKDKEHYANISEDGLVELGTNLFRHFLHDEYVSKFRKLLILEQYTNKSLSDIYIKRYIYEPLDYQGMAFKLLGEAGVLAPEIPQIMALHYYAPIFLLLSLCDAHPELEQEAIEMKKQHIRQFIRIYGTREDRNTENNKKRRT